MVQGSCTFVWIENYCYFVRIEKELHAVKKLSFHFDTEDESVEFPLHCNDVVITTNACSFFSVCCLIQTTMDEVHSVTIGTIHMCTHLCRYFYFNWNEKVHLMSMPSPMLLVRRSQIWVPPGCRAPLTLMQNTKNWKKTRNCCCFFFLLKWQWTLRVAGMIPNTYSMLFVLDLKNAYASELKTKMKIKRKIERQKENVKSICSVKRIECVKGKNIILFEPSIVDWKLKMLNALCRQTEHWTLNRIECIWREDIYFTLIHVC